MTKTYYLILRHCNRDYQQLRRDNDLKIDNQSMVGWYKVYFYILIGIVPAEEKDNEKEQTLSNV